MFSVTTLKAEAWMSLASSRLALTWVVISVSLERWLSVEVKGATTTSLKTLRTVGCSRTSFSMVWRSASLPASPVSSTWRL